MKNRKIETDEKQVSSPLVLYFRKITESRNLLSDKTDFLHYLRTLLQELA